MEIVNRSIGSGIINMVATIDDYEKTMQELQAQALVVGEDVAYECASRLCEAVDLIRDSKAERIQFDFSVEERIKSCVYLAKDWLATKTQTRFNVISALYQWKLEKFHDRAWDASMPADHCEGILFRLMERVSDESQNIAVIQVFLSIPELESCGDASIRIETRLKDGLERLKTMVNGSVPRVGVAKAN